MHLPRPLRAALAAALATLLAHPAHAGRPLATDDAGTAALHECQVEAWAEKARSDRALVLSPACGLAPGVELGAEFVRVSPSDAVKGEAGLAVKWAPEDLKLGPVNLGLKGATAWVRPNGNGWQSSGQVLLGLASMPLGESFTVHANLGLVRDRASRERATLLNAALTWAPSDRWLWFVEASANSRSERFGRASVAVGGRWWLVPERLGLDLTAGRSTGRGEPTTVTLGLGWYGIGF